MKLKLKRIFLTVSLLIVLIGIAIGYVQYYPYIHSKKVNGKIVRVARVTEPQAMIGGALMPSQIYSYAVAIKDVSGEIFTSSSEDRQWAVATEGMCAEAVYYPYPPWKLDKSSTYYGARLIRLYECPAP